MFMSEHKTALITGASSGIGLELARLFALDGYDIVAVARRMERLKDLKAELERMGNVKVTIITADLSKPGAGERVYNEVVDRNIRVDALVNNAGFGGSGEFIERDWKQDNSMVHVNVVSLVELTHFFAADMAERRTGEILNIASMAAFLPGPLQAVYFATKAFVLSLSQALTNELGEKGINVSVFCPGSTATEFATQAELEGSRAFSGKNASARDVAVKAYRGLKKKKMVALPGPFEAFAIRFLFPIMPRSFILKTARSFSDPAK